MIDYFIENEFVCELYHNQILPIDTFFSRNKDNFEIKNQFYE